MQHDLTLEGHRFALRPIRRGDAAFVAALRRDPELSRYIHATSSRVEDQEAWLDAYAACPDDYYFVVEDRKLDEAVGAVGLYNIDTAAKTGEWGRWLIRRDSLGAVESAVLIYRMAFERLGLDAVCCRTVADNAPVVSFHDSSGAERVGVLRDHITLSGQTYDAIEHRVTRARWGAIRPRLDALALRLAQR
jgi:RimJ/RimL family protein N-acetyltransferase